MFALTDADLRSRIRGCADGPASFNAEATRRGVEVTSADPLYRCAAEEIRDRIAATYDEILEQTRRNLDQFVWESIRSVEELGRVRMQAMQAFLDDYDSGKRQGRYVNGELPSHRFRTNPSTWLSARISFFSTPNICPNLSTGWRLWNYAGWPRKSGFFRCSAWMAARRLASLR
jgi:hypothetical protein